MAQKKQGKAKAKPHADRQVKLGGLKDPLKTELKTRSLKASLFDGKPAAGPLIIFFRLQDTSAVTVSIRLTNANNSATSLFRLTDISDPGEHEDIPGESQDQSDGNVFNVPPEKLQTQSGRCTLMLDFLPVSPSKGAVTLSVAANQNGVSRPAFDKQGKPLPNGPNGAPAGDVDVATPAHCVIVLLP